MNLHFVHLFIMGAIMINELPTRDREKFTYRPGEQAIAELIQELSMILDISKSNVIDLIVTHVVLNDEIYGAVIGKRIDKIADTLSRYKDQAPIRCKRS